MKNLLHNIIWTTKTGKMYRDSITWVGIKLMILARRCFKHTLGRCSWCGKDPGMGHISSKGSRCMNSCEME